MNHTDKILQTVYGNMVRCGVHKKELEQKRQGIEDAIDLNRELLYSLNANKTKNDLYVFIGVVAWSSIIVSNIILDAIDVGQAVESDPGIKMVSGMLKKLRAETQKNIYKGSSRGGDISKLDELEKKYNKIVDASKKLGGKHGDALKSAGHTFFSAAKSSVAMTGMLEDFNQLKSNERNNIAVLRSNIEKMQKSLESIRAQIADDMRTDDEGAGKKSPRTERFDRAPVIDMGKK